MSEFGTLSTHQKDGRGSTPEGHEELPVNGTKI